MQKKGNKGRKKKQTQNYPLVENKKVDEKIKSDTSPLD